jgi:drug/metabolite transporter (DMT)-like permease
VGQLILFETLFALLYGFLWERRWPAPHELIALLLLGAGLLASARAHRHPAAAPPPGAHATQRP